MWLCLNKTLFTKIGDGPDSVSGPQCDEPDLGIDIILEILKKGEERQQIIEAKGDMLIREGVDVSFVSHVDFSLLFYT